MSPSEPARNGSVSEVGQLVEIENEVTREKMEEMEKFSMSSTAFNFTNSIVGSGIIGMAYTFKLAGLGLGILVLCFVAGVSDCSILLLVEGGGLAKANSYQEIVEVAFGRPGFYALSLLQFLYPFIAMVSYNIIIGDTLTKIILWLNADSYSFVTDVLGNRQFVILVVTVLVTLPLSLYRNIGKLGKWASLSLVLIIFIVITIGIRWGDFAKYLPPTKDAWDFAHSDFLQAIGIVAFSFMCHHNTMLVYRSMERPTPQRWGAMVHLSVSLALSFCLLMGLLGYISFTGFTQGDLLENYCGDDVMMNCARFAFAITIMLTYPVECFVTREVVENVLFPTALQPPPLKRHVAVTVILTILITGVSMTTDCLGIVLALNGVLFAAPLAFIFPPCCVIRLRPDPLLSMSNLGPALMAIFGLVVMIVGTIDTVIDGLQSPSTCLHGSEPGYCAVARNLTVGFLSGSGGDVTVIPSFSTAAAANLSTVI